jgi:creatinine amidohydrolase
MAVHFGDLNWMQVEEYLRRDDRLMVVTGACEQHGYLSLMTDIRIPLAIAEEAAQRTGVLVAPPLNIGVSPAFARYPGTISLRVATFLSLVEDVVRSLHAQGFRRLLFVNGHGGNAPATSRLQELVNELPDLRVGWYSWWIAPSVQDITQELGRPGNHANWFEAFPMCRVAPLPEREKSVDAPNRLLNADEFRAHYGDGVMGGAYAPDDAVLERIFDAAVGDVVERLGFT